MGDEGRKEGRSTKFSLCLHHAKKKNLACECVQFYFIFVIFL